MLVLHHKSPSGGRKINARNDTIFQYCQFIFADVLRRRHRKYAKRHGNASFHPARMWSPVIDQRGVFFFTVQDFFCS